VKLDCGERLRKSTWGRERDLDGIKESQQQHIRIIKKKGEGVKF